MVFDYGEIIGVQIQGDNKNTEAIWLYFLPPGLGSHEIWFNQQTKKFTTIPNHPGDMPEGTLRAILKQADIGVDEFSNMN